MREEQHGRYYGVGMVIPAAEQQNLRDYALREHALVPAGIHPATSSPQWTASRTEGMTSDVVAKALKGPKGTHVQVTMNREGQVKPLAFDLVRDEIPHPSVDLKYEIRPGVGYIHLTQFRRPPPRSTRSHQRIPAT